MNKEEMKRSCMEEIDKSRIDIIDLGQKIYKKPELGYKEFETSKIIQKTFDSLGFRTEEKIAYTGVKAFEPKKNGPVVAVIGELDCIACAGHPDSNQDGNVHACGHNIQLANLYGCAVGLKRAGVLDALAGNVRFIAIPAEECVDYDYRNRLIQERKIEFYGGKQEYLKRGGFDDVDIILQCHMMDMKSYNKMCTVDTDCNGFVTKTVVFMGKAAHAGFTPYEGINALQMAELALNNINAIRETFKDEDKVRVSSIITKGGELVNVIPAEVHMQIMVRAFTIDAMIDAEEKVTRAVKAAALALGGKVKIREKMGYLPMKTNRILSELYRKNMIEYAGANENSFLEHYETAGSTDLGDISLMKPCMHIWTDGISGGLHSEEYRISDMEKAYILPAKMLAATIIDLLYDDGKEAKRIKDGYTPFFTKESYLKFMKDHSKVEVFDGSTL